MDTRSELRTYIAVMMAGFGLLLIGQLLVQDYMGWYDKPWDIFIFIPLYYLWVRYGVERVGTYVIGKINNRIERKNKKNV